MNSPLQRQLRQSAPFNSLEEEVVLSLRRVAHQLLQPWSDHLREHSDLTPVQYNVLRILRGAGPGGLTMGTVAERMIERGCDASRMVDRLATRGWVRREPDAEDRRVVRVVITGEGLERLAELDPVVAEMPQRALAGLDASQLKTLRDLLAVLLEGGEGNAESR